MSIKSIHRARRKTQEASLNLTSLMDIFTILVFFLLVSSQNPVQLPSTKNIALPKSQADQGIKDGLRMVIEKNRVLINDVPVMELQPNPLDNVYDTLAFALVQERKNFESSASSNGILDRDVTILSDKEVPFAVVRQIMRICGEQQFGRISFATLREKRNG